MNNQTATLRQARRTQSLSECMGKKSELFSAIVDETVTNREATMASLAFVFLAMAAITASASIVLALMMAACAAWAVYNLNKEGGEK